MRFLVTRVSQIEIDEMDIPDLYEGEDIRQAAFDLSFDIPAWEWDEIDRDIEVIDEI